MRSPTGNHQPSQTPAGGALHAEGAVMVDSSLAAAASAILDWTPDLPPDDAAEQIAALVAKKKA